MFTQTPNVASNIIFNYVKVFIIYSYITCYVFMHSTDIDYNLFYMLR